jgi:hypothetical protein
MSRFLRCLRAAVLTVALLSSSLTPQRVSAQQVPASDFPVLVSAVLQFKLHKDNPNQTPIGKPIALVAIGAALLFLPTIIGIAGPSFGSGPVAVLSCPVFIGGSTLLGEDGCVWTKAGAEWTQQEGVAIQRATYRAGGQTEIAPGWFLGGTLGAANQTTQGAATLGTGQSFDVAVALKYSQDALLLAGSAGFASNWSRFSGTPGILSDVDVTNRIAQIHLRGAYDFAFDGWYVRPRLDLALAYRNMPGFQVMSQGTTVMSVGAFSQTNFSATPMVEIGGRLDVESTGMIFRPYAAVGASFLPGNTSTFNVQFAGPLAFMGSFQPYLQGPSVTANVEAGVQLYRSRGLEFRAEYGLIAGTSLLSQTAALRAAWHF